MRHTLRSVLVSSVATVCLLGSATLFAQDSSAGTGNTSAKPKSHQKTGAPRSVNADLQEMKDAIAAQQQQIQQLQQQIQTRDQAITQLQQQVGNAQSTATQAEKDAAAAALKQAPETSSELTALQHDVTDLRATTGKNAEALTATDKRVATLETPLAIHYKGITITPGGFLAGETVWRPHATFSDINTPFNAIPFSAAPQARFSEFYGSGRQSRFSMLGEGMYGTTKVTGYAEFDFLGAGVTSNNNQSNSYVLRDRQLWAQAAFHNGWTFTGGQMWSLITETRRGLENRTEALPMQIDAQYTAGFSWSRQYALRATKNINNKVWLGLSVENAQTLLTVSGNPSNFVIGGPGTLGGLYNNQANYSSNVSPDFVGKVAFEPGFGHYEAFFVVSEFRTRIYPNATATPASAAGAFNNTTPGGGFGANARWLFDQKHYELGLHFLGGDGVGRFGDSTLPDLTVQGEGYEHPLHSYQALLTLEYHNPHWDLYAYGGGEYVGRWSTLYKGKPVGYGSPLFVDTGCGKETVPTAATGYGPGALAECSGNNRVVIEGTTGFWYKPYNGPKGRIQIGGQYSYLTRDAWSGIGGTPKAVENMIFTSFRYYLP